MDWRQMNKIQRLMVVDDFWNQSFEADDCVDQINDFIQKREEDTEGEYVKQLKRVDKEVAHQWRADLKNALRQLDDITDWENKNKG